MVFKDDEIKRTRAEEQAGAAKAQRDAAERKRQLKLFEVRLREAKRLKDRRGFERLLELQNVKRQTAAWDALWQYFYSDET
jgi:hypothetical protein